MKRPFLLLSIIVVFSSNSFSQASDKSAILVVLNTQVKAWNSGNIDLFMDGYWRSDSLMFIGKSGVTYGWKNTLDNYKKNYPDTSVMGKLDFSSLQFKKLSPEYYFVVGKWHLGRSIGDISGYFTLLFRKIGNKWFIVADHSS